MRPPQTVCASLILCAALIAAPALGAVTAPRVDYSQMARPLPLPYDEAADADAAVAGAIKRAKAQGKLVLIDLGGNWCLDCRILAGVIEIPALKAFVAKHYELVEVDVGRFDKNLQIPARYGITRRLEGVPALLVVDPRTDSLRNPGRTSALADARSMTAQALADWLAQWP